MTCKNLLLALFTLCLFAAPGLSSDAEQIVNVGVGVRALMKSPEEYPQQIRVSGVVSQVVEEAGILGLIDLEEFKTCNKVTCASLVLPIRWDGPMPEVGQQLTSTGKIRKEDGRYLFIATDLVVVTSQ